MPTCNRLVRCDGETYDLSGNVNQGTAMRRHDCSDLSCARMLTIGNDNGLSLECLIASIMNLTGTYSCALNLMLTLLFHGLYF